MIRTKYTTHPTSGASRIVAKCNGRQLTRPYDHALSASQNHAHAAAHLARKLKLSGDWFHTTHYRTFTWDCMFIHETVEGLQGEPCFRIGTADSALPWSLQVL